MRERVRDYEGKRAGMQGKQDNYSNTFKVKHTQPGKLPRKNACHYENYDNCTARESKKGCEGM